MNPLLILLCIIFLFALSPIIYTLYKRYSYYFEVKRITVSGVTVEANFEDVAIAYKMLIELKTRKIGLNFEPEFDTIVEVYNSWYESFKLIRELLKSLPVHKIKDNTVSGKVKDYGIKILNDYLRPHLTKWQAKFRRWYEFEKDKKENEHLSPQEIQRKFSEYDNLVDDLIKTNMKIQSIINELEQITRM